MCYTMPHILASFDRFRAEKGTKKVTGAVASHMYLLDPLLFQGPGERKQCMSGQRDRLLRDVEDGGVVFKIRNGTQQPALFQ